MVATARSANTAPDDQVHRFSTVIDLSSDGGRTWTTIDVPVPRSPASDIESNDEPWDLAWDAQGGLHVFLNMAGGLGVGIGGIVGAGAPAQEAGAYLRMDAATLSWASAVFPAEVGGRIGIGPAGMLVLATLLDGALHVRFSNDSGRTWSDAIDTGETCDFVSDVLVDEAAWVVCFSWNDSARFLRVDAGGTASVESIADTGNNAAGNDLERLPDGRFVYLFEYATGRFEDAAQPRLFVRNDSGWLAVPEWNDTLLRADGWVHREVIGSAVDGDGFVHIVSTATRDSLPAIIRADQRRIVDVVLDVRPPTPRLVAQHLLLEHGGYQEPLTPDVLPWRLAWDGAAFGRTRGLVLLPAGPSALATEIVVLAAAPA